MNEPILHEPETLAAEQAIYQRLDTLNIPYEMFEHAPLFTVEEALNVMDDIPGAHVKNLFLRDKKKNYFLITAYHETPIDLKGLRHQIAAKDINISGNLSFANAQSLWEQLQIRPGSVNPLVLMHIAKDANICFLLDETLVKAESVNLHPMRNDKSITLKSSDLMNFLEKTGHFINVFDFTNSTKTPD